MRTLPGYLSDLRVVPLQARSRENAQPREEYRGDHMEEDVRGLSRVA